MAVRGAAHIGRAGDCVDVAIAAWSGACPRCRLPLFEGRANELKAAFDAMRPGAIAPGPTAYHGPTPDFHAGANPELKQFAGIMGYGVLGMLSAVVGVGAAAIGAGAASAARDD
jgi:hypothetical protein